MPCIVNGDAGIPIAEFGSSNVGQMKRIYRNGLSVRYGRKMQAIAGIHYNFSLPESFWIAAGSLAGSDQSAAGISDTRVSCADPKFFLSGLVSDVFARRLASRVCQLSSGQ